MRYVVTPQDVTDNQRPLVGGKAFALAMMWRKGIRVPDWLCITTTAYGEYLSATGLSARIGLELNRKRFEDMRWEEIWDASLRIRNMFLKTPVPGTLEQKMRTYLDETFMGKSVAVRSSAPGEDSSQVSFAGLHESYINVQGTEAIVEHIRLVWASLWSDRALLYRKELGLDIRRSTMAVVVQELVPGERSGIIFTVNPTNPGQSVVEAVHGLNQGLVDGTIEPDRWFLDRETGAIVSHAAAQREMWVIPSPSGISFEKLPPGRAKWPPLKAGDLKKVFGLGRLSEKAFGGPQDMEWCFRQHLLFALQSRPITTSSDAAEADQRPWYLSLHRSFENLKALRRKVEEEIIPGMERDGATMSHVDLRGLTDSDLAAEIERREKLLEDWKDTYTRDCIPFAHGMRLFGQVYNDMVKPADPFEFMDLLRSDGLAGLDRNRILQQLASQIRRGGRLKQDLEHRVYREEQSCFWQGVDNLIARFGTGGLTGIEDESDKQRWRIVTLLLEMASHEGSGERGSTRSGGRSAEDFLKLFNPEKQLFAADLLDLGRASYRLRDDDNIALGRVESEVSRGLDEGRARIKAKPPAGVQEFNGGEIVKALRHAGYVPTVKTPAQDTTIKSGFKIKARQIVGQPAGPGIATGKARVILDDDKLFDFKAGEVLVCDAIDPNMTFVVPLAAAIVERRGGMLIHGAIIAREYGIPCVTGIPGATELISTGDQITVDGYLGIVVIGQERK